jgi:pyruvate dehydrogenase complex dehydrogenase (E1) component
VKGISPHPGLIDEQIDRLNRGGYDLVKIHAACVAAVTHRGQLVVILNPILFR